MRGFSVLLVVLFGIFFPVLAKSGKLLFSHQTSWGEILVRQQGDVRLLLFAEDGKETEESRMSVRTPHRPILRYVKQMLAATALWQANSSTPPEKVLVVGLGGASLSNALAHHYPEATITSIELEPGVVEAAHRYFFYRESARVVTVIDDARHFLETTEERYDLIFLDAFAGLEVPPPLRTIEFARTLESHLSPKGAVVANVHHIPEESSHRYQRALHEVFSHRVLLAGIAQAVGIYSNQEVALSKAPKHAFDLDLQNFLQPYPLPQLDRVRPYQDQDE